MSTEPDTGAPELPPGFRQIARLVVLDGLCSHITGVLTTGAILVGFALHLGASNAVIGLISGIPFLAQLLQLPAVYVVNWVGHRRTVVVAVGLFGRMLWLTAGFIPWVVPEAYRVEALVLIMTTFFSLNALVNCAWSSWMRDLVPDKSMGSLFGRRMSIGTAFAALLSLFAGYAIDHFTQYFEQPAAVYSLLFMIGGSFGVLGVLFLWLTPEPRLAVAAAENPFRVLAEPFRDTNYRNLLMFLGTWSFAANLAAPFFTVYMLKQLQLSMTWVLALSVLSQMVNVLFFRVWGALSDRLSNKSVLNITGFLFLLTFLIWPFTTMPRSHVLTLPMLVVIHVMAGVATAGVTLCTGNIALRAAPYGRATAYLAVNALISGTAATTAPVIAGSMADWFSAHELRLDLTWSAMAIPGDALVVPALNLSGYDFLFIIAFCVGLYAMHRLLIVKEEGEVKERVVLHELFLEVRRIARSASNVAGLRHLGYFPFGVLKSIARNGERESGGP